MKITLKKLAIQHFKGIGTEIITLDGHNATITGANGVGKTTVYDAFLWLLFGKDSDGKTDFGIHPLDKNNKPLKDVVVNVTGLLDLDGDEILLQKEQHERVVKGQLTGYTNLCYINEVPTKVGEYNRQIEKIIPEGIFKILTDLRYFAEKLPWSDRRKVLLELAGDVGAPEGFEELVAGLQNRTIIQQKNRLTELKKRFTADRDNIPPRIDELQIGISQYADTTDSPATIEAQRGALQAEIDHCQLKMSTIIDQEKERQEQLEHLNQMKRNLAEREAAITADTSGTRPLLDERVKLETAIADIQSTVEAYSQKIKQFRAKKQMAETALKNYHDNMDEVRIKYQKLIEAKIETNCFECGQVLPTERIAEMKEKREERLEELSAEGASIKEKVDAQAKHIEEVNMQVGSAVKMHNEAVMKAEKLQTKTDTRIKEIQEALKNQAPPDLSKDPQWLAINEKIKTAELNIGEPVASQLIDLEKERNKKNAQVKTLNDTLAQSDRIKKDKSRIKDLEAEEKRLAQTIADADKELSEIAEYLAAESTLVETAVNGRFKHVTFKLFKQLLNEGLMPCCEVILNGVIYADMSSGEKIFTGLDIVNILSMHYGFSLPLFIDHVESVTLPLETHMQTIGLKAIDDEKLTVEIED